MRTERRVRQVTALLLGGVQDGRTGRAAFAVGVVLALLGFALTLLVLDLLVRGAEGFSVGGAPSLPGLLAQFVGFAVAGFAFTAMATFGFAVFNLIAKRARDLGLAGWKALAVATMLGTAFSLGAPLLATGIYVATVWVALLAMPSRPRRAGSQPEPQ